MFSYNSFHSSFSNHPSMLRVNSKKFSKHYQTCLISWACSPLRLGSSLLSIRVKWKLKLLDQQFWISRNKGVTLFDITFRAIAPEWINTVSQRNLFPTNLRVYALLMSLCDGKFDKAMRPIPILPIVKKEKYCVTLMLIYSKLFDP